MPDNPVRNHAGVTLAHYEVQHCLVLPGEVLVVDVLGDRHLGHVELGGGGDQVPLVHPPEEKKFYNCRQLGGDVYLSGQPLSLWGPVTSRRPVPSCFRTTTRLPKIYRVVFLTGPP